MREQYIITKQRMFVPNEELEQFKDFETLLSGYKSAADTQGRVWTPARRFLAGMFALAVIASSVYFIWRYLSPSENIPLYVITPKTYTEDYMSNPSQLALPVPTNDKRSSSENKTVDTAPQGDRSTVVEAEQRENKDSSAPNEDSTSGSYTYVQAEPVEGMAFLYGYFDNELRYPETALVDSIEGTTVIFFSVDIQGDVSDIEIEQSLGEDFDQEAIRLIKNMPEWRPASVNGKPVKSRVSVPLQFHIEKY